MDRAVVWTRAAASDLDAALDLVAAVSPSFTAAMTQELVLASRSLREFSERGRVVPEVGKQDLREIVVRDSRVIYRIDDKQVTIVAFFHGRMDFDRAWGQGR